jgi:SPW repeat
MEPNTHMTRTVKAASSISMLAAIWLFVSPWIYGAYHVHDAWNSWIVGFAIVVFAAIRLGNPLSMAWLSWVNSLLGIWTFASPWIFGYTRSTGRFVNSLCVGLIVFIAAMRSATSTPHHGTPLPTGV